jgi:hypothetical protein
VSGTAQRQTPTRGVYWARHRKNGRLIAYAIDSDGNEVRRLVLQDESQWRCDAAVEHLWNHLDVVDPVGVRPVLHLVKTTAPILRTDRPAPAVYDPYNLPPLPWSRRV